MMSGRHGAALCCFRLQSAEEVQQEVSAVSHCKSSCGNVDGFQSETRFLLFNREAILAFIEPLMGLTQFDSVTFYL